MYICIFLLPPFPQISVIFCISLISSHLSLSLVVVVRAKLDGAKQNEPKCGAAQLPKLPERIYFDQNKLKQGSCQRHLYFGLIFTHKFWKDFESTVEQCGAIRFSKGGNLGGYRVPVRMS